MSSSPWWPGGDPPEPRPLDAPSALFERRVVLLSGELTDEAAGHVVAQLMTLDATGDEAIVLQVNAWGGTLDAAFSVMDTIDSVGVPVQTACVGRAEGPAVGVVAVGAHRRAGSHARFRLCQPQFATSGTAAELAEWSLHCRRRLDRFADRLAQATGRPSAAIIDDLDRGRFLSADEAMRYGLIDDVGVNRPDVGPHRRRLGFARPAEPPTE